MWHFDTRVFVKFTTGAVTWLNHMWQDLIVGDKTCSYVIWLIHMWHGATLWYSSFREIYYWRCDMTHSCVTWLTHVTWLIHTHIHKYTHTHTHTWTGTHHLVLGMLHDLSNTHTDTHRHTQTQTNTHTNAHTHIYIHAHTSPAICRTIRGCTRKFTTFPDHLFTTFADEICNTRAEGVFTTGSGSFIFTTFTGK